MTTSVTATLLVFASKREVELIWHELGHNMDICVVARSSEFRDDTVSLALELPSFDRHDTARVVAVI